MIWGLGGIYARITGIRATNAIKRAAKLPIRSPRPVSWKNMPKLITPRSQRGMNIVKSVTPGNLYKGIVKWAY